MGLNIRGKQDGTGPFKSSLQLQEFSVGKRKQEGYECPFELEEKRRFIL